MLAWSLCVVTLLAIPVAILDHGFLPPDDATRHVAKVISGKSWPEIMVMRSDITIDLHSGWHALLSAVRRWTDTDKDGLITLAICGLFYAFTITPLRGMARPESWIVTLLLATISGESFAMRLCLGRPFLVPETVLVAILLLSSRTPRWSAAHLVAMTLALALSSWLHGSYYLFALPVGAFLLAGAWRQGLELAGAWICGSVLGACFTGRPVDFLVQQVAHMRNVVGHDTMESVLTTEMRASDGALPVLVVAFAAAVLDRLAHGRWRREQFESPLFVLALLGWVLGFKVERFWLDWGLPALLVWLALQIDAALAARVPAGDWRRVAACGLACIALFHAMTSDRGSRYSSNLSVQRFNLADPEQAAWLPEPGGILYSTDMGVFYRTFWANPSAPWRYAFGFEAGLMTDENLAVFRAYQASSGDVRTLSPWVERMTPQDRLVVRATAATRPNVPALEWRYVLKDTWIGKLPRAPGSS